MRSSRLSITYIAATRVALQGGLLAGTRSCNEIAPMRAAVTNDQLLEVLGALSLTTDLANGNPMGSALRSCAIAIEVSRELGIGAEKTWTACYAALLRHIGCTSYAHEEAS